MATWIEKLKVANRHGGKFFLIPFLGPILCFWLAARPTPSLEELQHETGPLTEILYPPKGPAVRLVVDTKDGAKLYMLDGGRAAVSIGRELRHGDWVEIWSRIDGEFPHVWQLASNGTVLLDYEGSSRVDRRWRVFSAVMGILIIGVGFGYVEYLFRKHDPAKCSATVRRIPAEDGDPEHYVAVCECGWMGDDHDREGPAREEALKHTPKVAIEVEEIY